LRFSGNGEAAFDPRLDWGASTGSVQWHGETRLAF